MFEWLDTMRKRPLSRRRLVAFGVSLLFTGLLFVVWLTVWLPDFKQQTEQTAKNEKFETPTTNVLRDVASAWSAITEKVLELKDVTSSTTLRAPEELTAKVHYSAPTTTVGKAGTEASLGEPSIVIINVSSTTQAQ